MNIVTTIRAFSIYIFLYFSLLSLSEFLLYELTLACYTIFQKHAGEEKFISFKPWIVNDKKNLITLYICHGQKSVNIKECLLAIVLCQYGWLKIFNIPLKIEKISLLHFCTSRSTFFLKHHRLQFIIHKIIHKLISTP